MGNGTEIGTEIGSKDPMQKMNENITSLQKSIEEYSNNVNKLKRKVQGRRVKYTENDLDAWLNAEKKLEEAKDALQKLINVVDDVRGIFDNVGGKRNTRRKSRKSRKSRK